LYEYRTGGGNPSCTNIAVGQHLLVFSSKKRKRIGGKRRIGKREEFYQKRKNIGKNVKRRKKILRCC
jgi:hypothetical protein